MAPASIAWLSSLDPAVNLILNRVNKDGHIFCQNQNGTLWYPGWLERNREYPRFHPCSSMSMVEMNCPNLSLIT